MPIIKFTDKAFLREHPFLDPISQPAPVQTHSYIYPGDELVLYHKITLPDDASVLSINDIKLISAKTSLIAQKPQVYSEEYSEQYQSTRNFELDSFTTSFTPVNAVVHPWGSDGYAADVNVKQNRSWKLPAGDFRRQINWFTTHTPSTPSWEYWFYFPIIFRWEQWIALLGANNDFYDTAQPQNGQNQWWYHYFVLNKWLIKSRLDLNVLINGVPTIIRSELNLTPGTVDVNDYNSNADWTTESIKTAKIGDTPSNSPAFVYGNKNTQVWGYFEKVSPWGGDEQGNISAIIWIEPFQNAGITVRRRVGSSLYPITSEDVGFGLDTSITDDSGTGIQTDGGDYIVTDGNGNGAIVLFNGTQPEKVQVFALIDYNKINNAYPGVTKFTLYCRLYNSTLVGDETMQGEEIKQDLVLISPPDTNVLCEQKEPHCPYNIDAFADAADSDELKNDKAEFYQYGDALIGAIEFTLQKNTSYCGDGAWVDKATITDNTYGKFFAFGKSNDFSGLNFIDDYGKRYTGFLLEWRKIIIPFGVGAYRMRVKTTDVFSNDVTTYDQRIFCLKAYNCNLADRSVRLQMTNIGLRGTLDNGSTFIDYAGGWYGEIRLRGLFYEDNKPDYVEEYTEYGDSKFNLRAPYIAELHPKCILELRPIPGWMDRYLKNYFLLADSKLVTDYNTRNVNTYVKFPVINGGFESLRQGYSASERLAAARLSLSYAQNNLRKTNSQ